jgi:hypothetical protein
MRTLGAKPKWLSIATLCWCCNYYMIIATRTLEGDAKVVLNCNPFLELQVTCLLQRELGAEVDLDWAL